MEQDKIFKPEIRERFRNKWIAVVDDSPEIVTLTKIALEKYGLEDIAKIHVFTSCEKFIERAGDYDVCILDGKFAPGDMSGDVAVPKIYRRNPDIFIVANSSEEVYQTKMKEAGVDYAIDKDKLTEELPRAFREMEFKS